MKRLGIATLLVSIAVACDRAPPLADGLPATIECNGCHGDAESAAPPRALHGEASPSEVGVGAHRLHLRDTPIRAAVVCGDCHVVPAAVDSPGHVDATRAPVVFSALATRDGAAAPAWNPEEATCSQVYCHGATLAGGSPAALKWTYHVEPDPARPAAEICGSCHAARPAAPHPQVGPCAACHAATVLADGAIDVAGGLHVNGTVDEDAGAAPCGACHAVPGASGAHAVHYADASEVPLASYGDVRTWADYPAGGVAGYVFGCGNCHPLHPARHMNGTVEVDLSPAGAPAGSVKARNRPDAAHAADGRCSGVYCHSSGQQSPAYAATPAWDSDDVFNDLNRNGTRDPGEPASLGCDACHGNPPRYASGAAGSATANTHLVPRTSTYLTTVYTGGYGHYAWHNRTRASYTQNISGQHGVNDADGAEQADGSFGAAPMTCQTCHFDTVDPAATGPSGFYWLDTTGRYDVPGQNYAAYNCTASGCHGGTPALAQPGAGRVLPRLHVNGRRDVVFDPRTEPSPYGAPLGPLAPEFPYWVTVTSFRDAAYLPEGATFAPAAPGSTTGTISFRLNGASYDPDTKTCSAVACHLRQATVAWGGTGLGTMATCFGCHTTH